MSKLYGQLSQQSGSFGNMTVSVVNGQSVLKQKPAKVKNPRTFKQMKQRVRIANITNLWNAFTGKDRPSFENKPRTWSDNNAFVSANLSTSPVFLTKQEAQQACCVVAAYQVTRGSLPSILVGIGNDHKASSDIAVGSLAIGSSTELGQFSRAVVENNRSFRYGDQISVFVAEQMVNSVTGNPYVEMACHEVTLKKTSDELLEDIVGANVFGVQDGMLTLANAVIGAVAFVHSRKTSKGTAVSTQRFVVDNPTLSQYTTDEALTNAILSYGGNLEDYFLTPNIDNVAAPESGD